MQRVPFYLIVSKHLLFKKKHFSVWRYMENYLYDCYIKQPVRELQENTIRSAVYHSILKRTIMWCYCFNSKLMEKKWN